MMFFRKKQDGPPEGTWRIRENAGKFYVERWERHYYPSMFFTPQPEWHQGYGYRGSNYPVTDTLEEAERWIDEQLHPEKYNHIVATYGPGA